MSTMRMVVLSCAVSGAAATADAQAARGDAQAAKFGIAVVHVVPFDGRTLPAVTTHGFGASLHRLCFQRDGARLFVCSLAGHDPGSREPRYRIDAIDVASGSATDVSPANSAVLLGASARGPLLLGDGKLSAPDEPQWAPLPVPDRTDAFLSPYGPHAVLCTLDRRLRTQLVDLTKGTGSVLRIGQHFASAVAFTPNGRVAIARAQAVAGGSVSSEGIRVVDAAGGLVRDLPAATRGVHVLAFAAGGERLVYADDRLHLVALADGAELARHDEVPQFWAGLGDDAAVSHDGHVVRLHNPATLQRVKEFPLQATVPDDVPAALRARGGVLLAAVANDGSLLAVATYGAITVFRITRGT